MKCSQCGRTLAKVDRGEEMAELDENATEDQEADYLASELSGDRTARLGTERQLRSPGFTGRRSDSPRSTWIRQALDGVKGSLRRQRMPPLTRFLACRKIPTIGAKRFLKSLIPEIR